MRKYSKYIYHGKNWDVIFCDWKQHFLGYCVISNQKEHLGSLTTEEWQELGILEKELERVMKKLFNATMFNFCCLMNNAYRDDENPHVHFHFIPRYKNTVEIFNKSFIDKFFGYNFYKWNNDKINKQKDIFKKEEKEIIFNLIKKEFFIKNSK